MASAPQDTVVADQLDRALLRLRRFVEAPRQVADRGAPVELSTLLVVDALLRGGAASSIGDVARELGVAHSTASRFVDRAQRAGMVERVTRSSDTRRQGVRLTAEGRGLADRARQFRWSRLDALLEQWESADRAALATLLTRFADEVQASALE